MSIYTNLKCHQINLYNLFDFIRNNNKCILIIVLIIVWIVEQLAKEIRKNFYLVRVRRPSGTSSHCRHQEAHLILDDVQAAPTGASGPRDSTHSCVIPLLRHNRIPKDRTTRLNKFNHWTSRKIRHVNYRTATSLHFPHVPAPPQTSNFQRDNHRLYRQPLSIHESRN